MAFVHPASVTGVFSGKDAVAASAIRGMKSFLRRGSSTFGSKSFGSSVDLTGSTSRGGVKYRTVGNIGTSVVRCEPLQGHARSTPAVVAARGGAASGGDDSIAGAGSSRTMPDGAWPVCVISWGSGAGDDHVLCCEGAKEAAAWLGAISWHLCRCWPTPHTKPWTLKLQILDIQKGLLRTAPYLSNVSLFSGATKHLLDRGKD